MPISVTPISRRHRWRLLLVVSGATLAMAFALLAKDTLNVWLTTALISAYALTTGFLVHGANLWRLCRLTGRSATLGMGTGLLMAALTKMIYPVGSAWLPQISVEVADLYTYLAQPPGIVMALPILLLVVIAEECVWRGLLIDALPSMDSVNTVIFWSAVVYGLPHLMSGSLILFGVALVCGTIWGALRLSTGSIVAPHSQSPVVEPQYFCLFPSRISDFWRALPILFPMPGAAWARVAG